MSKTDVRKLLQQVKRRLCAPPTQHCRSVRTLKSVISTHIQFILSFCEQEGLLGNYSKTEHFHVRKTCAAQSKLSNIKWHFLNCYDCNINFK